MIEVKKADPYSKEYKSATIEVLVGDALARKDEKALEWLRNESGKRVKRTRKGSNVEFEAKQNIAKLRSEYAKLFLNYIPNSKKASDLTRQRKREEEETARQDFFEKAFKQLKAKK